MFSQPWFAWPRALERRGTIVACVSLDIAFLAVEATLMGVSSGSDVIVDVSDVVGFVVVAVNALMNSKSGVE